MVYGLFQEHPEPRYERQLQNVNHLVLHTIQDKHNIQVSMKDLERILEVLHEYRVI